MPTWPATLPQLPSFDTYKESPPDVLLRTQMDQGPARVRRRYTAGVRPFEWGQIFTETQLGDLETFFVTTLGYGALSFTFPHPYSTGETITVRFVGVPEYTSLGAGLFKVGFKLEELP